MKVTGYQIRDAINRWGLRRDTASKLFDLSLTKFPGEDKPHPREAISNFTQAEDAIARLQVARDEYNLRVRVEIDGQSYPLAYAAKRIGGAGRTEKKWKVATQGENKPRYMRHEAPTTRRTDEIVAERVVPIQECMLETQRAASYASQLRSQMATANAKEVEIESLTPDLFV